MAIEWSTPPDATRESASQWDSDIAELRKHPNLWGCVAYRATQSKAQSVAQAFRRHESFHVRCRKVTNNGKTSIGVWVLYGDPKKARDPQTEAPTEQAAKNQVDKILANANTGGKA